MRYLMRLLYLASFIEFYLLHYPLSTLSRILCTMRYLLRLPYLAFLSNSTCYLLRLPCPESYVQCVTFCAYLI